ncbi:hypothetical protein DEU56DRAFT_724721 [Suillus clintonianus]|uniref:uncharacterized protein n=1 Tax=Suillus clintonianus TaxID=1904413 RepID=UPI001B865B38|nr:uncharacterized protein DEU56DRAFT_724721 [Suillus clintonianus]KAG2155611.1 hypothetical protein DEU56DRAFT_724721 [Suillus clintonianus]
MDVPPGWITVVHPEGSRYFVNLEKRTCTEMNICDEEIREDIEYCMHYFLRELELAILTREELQLDMKQVDLVLEPKKNSENFVVFHYYFVNHRDRTLFWLDEFNPKEILSNCQGVESLSHIQLAVQAQYWRHWDYFPSLCSVTQNLVNEVKDMLVYATCDHMVSRQSSAPYDLIQLRDYISLVDSINVSSFTYLAVIYGDFLARNRFTNFHGEDCARLSFKQTVHGWFYTPSLLLFVFAPLLFFEFETHITELHKIFADKIAYKPRWDAYSLKFRGQLNDSNLMASPHFRRATVLLNANVGFLAINTVDRGGTSVIQMASYMSVVTSLGSIFLGLSLVSQDRTCGEHTASEITSFLTTLHNEDHGLEKLAIIYSLPKALLMWGMFFFYAAFSVDWWLYGDTISRAVVGFVALVVFMVIFNGMIRTKRGRHPLEW